MRDGKLGSRLALEAPDRHPSMQSWGSDTSRALQALEALWPVPALLLEQGGRILWASEEARRRVGSRSLSGLFSPPPAVLEPGAIERATRDLGLVRDGEALAISQAYLLTTGREVLLLQVVEAPDPGTAASLARLSPREREVARLATEGYTVLNIAGRLGIAESTVKTHLLRIYRKLDVTTRVGLTQRIA